MADKPAPANGGNAGTTPVWQAFPDPNQFADLLTEMEGGRSNSVAMRNNNPGNLKDLSGNFIKFNSYAEGRQALLDRMNDWRKRFPDMTIAAFNHRYAPDSDNAPGTEAGRNQRMMSTRLSASTGDIPPPPPGFELRQAPPQDQGASGNIPPPPAGFVSRTEGESGINYRGRWYTYKEATRSGPNQPAGLAEAAMAKQWKEMGGTPAMIKDWFKTWARAANAAMPVFTGGASLPVQSLMQGGASGLETATQGGTPKQVARSAGIGAAIPPAATVLSPVVRNMLGRSTLGQFMEGLMGRNPFQAATPPEPVYPGAPFPETPSPSFLRQNRPVYPGAPFPERPPATFPGARLPQNPGEAFLRQNRPVYPGAPFPAHPGVFPGAPFPEHPGTFPGAPYPEAPGPSIALNRIRPTGAQPISQSGEALGARAAAEQRARDTFIKSARTEIERYPGGKSYLKSLDNYVKQHANYNQAARLQEKLHEFRGLYQGGAQ